MKKNPEPIQSFGAYVREQRLAQGLTQRQLAEMMSISHVYLGEVERGVRRPFTSERINSLFAALPGMNEIIANTLRLNSCSNKCPCMCHNKD
jgi:transcriptional regulator with XRE-family HTH domain